MLKKRTMSCNKDLEVVFVSLLRKLDSPFQPKNIKELTYSNFEHTSVYSYSIPLASNGLCKARITEFSIIFEKFLFICFFTLILKKMQLVKKMQCNLNILATTSCLVEIYFLIESICELVGYNIIFCMFSFGKFCPLQ